MTNGRNDQRAGMEITDRVRLLEHDMDALQAVGDRLASRLESLQRVGVGILASMVVSSMLLAANLAVGL